MTAKISSKKSSGTLKAEILKPTRKDSFLPEGYKIPKKSDQFMKLTPGKHKIRIMTPPIRGFVFFAEEADEKNAAVKRVRPIRRTEEFGDYTVDEMKESGAKETNGKIEGSKYFWLIIIWAYAEKRFKCLEITQATVLEHIIRCMENEEYGDPRGYDLTIERTGATKNDTEYSAIPSPPKPVDKAIKEEFDALSYSLAAVMDGEYPFQ